MDESELKFSVDSRLLGELGERLVRKNYIALAELIKNAYDADSKSITIKFINSKDKEDDTSQIHLIDDGHGMTYEEVENYWMRIATPYKVREPISKKYGRRKTGSKGIGRFACRRLAHKLTIETVAKIPKSKEYERTIVHFNWADFISGTDISEIPCKSKTEKIKNGKVGTILKLIKLNEKWTDNQFNVLRRQILSISIAKGIRRKGYEEDLGFDIIMDAPEFPGGKGRLAETFMSAGWGKLTGKINKSGTLKLELKGKGIKKQSYTIPEKFDEINIVEFQIAMIPLDKKYYRDTDLLTKGGARDILEDVGGVKVFFDGFRIYPYGEPGDDWLGLDRDKARSWGSVDKILSKLAIDMNQEPSRAMLAHPYNKNLIGQIYINSYDDMKFDVKINREGFIENDAYYQLIRSIRLSLQWATLYYNKFRLKFENQELKMAEKVMRRKVKEIKKERNELDDIVLPPVTEALEVLSMESKRAYETLPKNEVAASEKRVKAATEVIQRTISRSEAYSSVLSAIASSGTYMMTFSHEVKLLINRLDTHANTINRISKSIPKSKHAEFREFETSLRSTRERLEHLIKLFGILGKRTSDQTRKSILVKNEVNEILQGFGHLIEFYIEKNPEIDIPDKLETGLMLEAEFFSIFVNLISNAIKAMIAGGGENLLIKAWKEDEKTVLCVYNDGIELSEEYWDEVFEPLVSDPEHLIYSGLEDQIDDKEITSLGRGSGLGLTIVREMVEKYDGDAYFVKVKKPWKTGIEVILP